MTYNKRLLLPFMLLFLLMAACSSTPEEKTVKVKTAEQYYQQAQSAIQGKRYSEAISLLRELEATYPYGPYTQQAQLDLIFVYYKNREYEQALAAAERFITLYPNHPKVDYAYYMRGLALFDTVSTKPLKFFKQEIIHRQQDDARASFQYFAVFVQRFPNSEYAADARQRMIALRNRIAAYEVAIAQYYYDRENYVAAYNRGKYVVDNYTNTPAVADALVIMARASEKMGLTEQAENAWRVLKLNFPHHPAVTGQVQPKR
jgi:outer membrane protein assembly factor BamD